MSTARRLARNLFGEHGCEGWDRVEQKCDSEGAAEHEGGQQRAVRVDQRGKGAAGLTELIAKDEKSGYSDYMR
jgi:hypothetical protein